MTEKDWRDREYLCSSCGTYAGATIGMDTMPSECGSCSNSGPYTVREECNKYTVDLLREIFEVEKECSYERLKACEKLRDAYNLRASRFHDLTSYDEIKFKEVELRAKNYIKALRECR